jgi:hypothetical protein
MEIKQIGVVSLPEVIDPATLSDNKATPHFKLLRAKP